MNASFRSQTSNARTRGVSGPADYNERLYATTQKLTFKKILRGLLHPWVIRKATSGNRLQIT
jgi:hypothetical protein